MYLSMVGRGWFVSRGWSVVSWGFMDWLVRIVAWGAFVSYFNNVTRVSISCVVLNNLSATIWKGNTVFAIS